MSEPKRKRFEDLSPEAQAIIRKKSLGAIFFASLIMGIMGSACVIEGAYVLLRDEAFLAERFKDIDLDKAKLSSLMLAGVGALEALCAVGTIRLSETPYRAGFYVTLLVAGNRFVDAMVFHGTFFTFGSLLNLLLALFALMFLFAGRYAILTPPPQA
ncbi:MAG: hypothetical protein NZM06_04775 [Chloroherpetonaceae bacterium]|nr:hypothetical protein [Chloroherpetonaceae bacterium]MDW8437835.1 hypothetical protein [Chloroherpetonaceae bacterium]